MNSILGHEHVRCLFGCGHFCGPIRPNDRRNLQHIILCVKYGDGHRIFAAVAWILVRLLHQIDHFRIEVGPRRRLVHDQMANTLQPGATEEMGAFRVQHEMCAAVEEHRPGPIYFAVLQNTISGNSINSAQSSPMANV